MTALHSPLALRGATLPNRLVVSPMCQYSVRGGLIGDYHLAHLGRFALGGFGTVIIEATAVTPEGRITYGCPGLWSDAHVDGVRRVVDFLHAQGVVAGLQLAHAGRKASTLTPWLIGSGQVEPDAEHWQPVAPSAVPHAADAALPRALAEAEMDDQLQAWSDAATRAATAGIDLLEIHGAHGYLISEFLSPEANRREDAYGGSRENRMRFPLQVIGAVRAAWPADRPLSLRISAEDGLPGGWSIDDSIALVRAARDRGVDLIDVSGGGFHGSRITPRAGMFLDWAEAIRAAAGGPVMTVGLMGDPALAEAAVAEGRTDLVALGRAALDDPNWPLHAARALGAETAALWPRQMGYAIDRWPMRPPPGRA